MINTEQEVWKDVVGLNGLYIISSLGNIRRTKPNRWGRKININSNLKQSISNGYPVVSLTNEDGWQKQFKIHRLVAQAFIPNPQNKLCVNHINGIKHDNRLENLEWTTISENTLHAYHTLKSICAPMGSADSSSKKVYQYSTNGELITTWGSGREAQRNGFSQKNISQCALGKCNTHMGYVWSYVELDKDYFIGIRPKKQKHEKAVYQIDSNGNIIKEHVNIRSVIKDGFNCKSVSAVCNGAKNRPTHKGYYWRFAKE